MANGRIEIKSPDTAGEIAPGYSKHPNALYSELLQVAADPSIVEMYEVSYGDDLWVIKTMDDLPKNLPHQIYEKIHKVLTDRNFDKSLDEVAILLPFVGYLRGFIFEIFKKDFAYEYIDELIKGIPNLKVHGYKVGLKNYLFKPTSLFWKMYINK